jgi:AbrB family looped-hinge helix DNA binding protein
MAKVTSKLQVTVPKALADRYGIAPGDDIAWEAAGDAIRVVPAGKRHRRDRAWRARLFDQATARHRRRQRARPATATADRGWKREDLYDRDRSR